MTQTHPARELSLRSREYVQNRDKANWLAMFAEDAIIQDPIGPSYLDPEGKGFATPARREEFWDRNIANSKISITINRSFSVGRECANVLNLVIEYEFGGQHMRQTIDGVFTYEVDAAGMLKALRGYWSEAEDSRQDIVS